MIKINSYSFGHMIIDGREFTSDLKIFPDGAIIPDWWREQGHQLIIKDITDLLETKPEILIVGTGSHGFMKIESNLAEYLEINNIEILALPTKKAVEEYNKLSKDSKSIAACFHLTC